MIPKNFKYLCDLLYRRSGLVLSDNKAYLVEARLMPFVRQRNLKSLDGLVEAIRCDKNEELIREITDAMTTNESFFFRDGKPFKIFQESILPALLENRPGTKKIRIWCAAAATGQEPYTLAMILKEEVAKLGNREVEIVATDISDESLERARTGIYTQFEVQRGLPIQLLVKYFSQENDNRWRVNEDIRKMVSLRHMNLLGDLSILGTFDIVFCRNVLIYFDQPTKIQVLEKLSKRMASDGVLFLGGAETVLGISDSFKPMLGARGAYGMGGSDGAVGMVAALSSAPVAQQTASQA
ncbi:MAG: chemotaxis protein CheR [Rhodospirillaceae bacterium]|nr:MAG: chemotaxis protein CheR [Rhodospirillaceae bacterium]